MIALTQPGHIVGYDMAGCFKQRVAPLLRCAIDANTSDYFLG